MSIAKGSNILWVDFLANSERLADPKEQTKLMQNASRSNITHIVVDAKIPYGHTTYPSQYALHVDTWSDGRYERWKGRDFLGELLEAGHAYGLQVYANINVFAEGINNSNDGLAYQHKDWQVKYYQPAVEGTPAQYINAEGYRETSLFVNPIHEEVQKHQLNIIEEVVTNYKVDGVVLDRCRYPNIYGDFSSLSREGFEKYIGQKVSNWPEDIFVAESINEHEEQLVRGPLFKKWVEWRAGNIKRFVQRAKKHVKQLNPNCLFSIYVGSWYPLYYNEGVNWASTSYQSDLDWVSNNYHEAGYADELDFLMTGCYYPEVYKEEAQRNNRPADWYSVEGAIEVSANVVNSKIPFFASLYLNDYHNNIEQFKKAVQLCREQSHGVMLFDVCYLEIYQWWDAMPDMLQD